MPRGNGTGPMGIGPRTGRAAGFCAGYSVPGYANPMPGIGAFGGGARGARGSGGGRGHRNWYYATGLTGWSPARRPYAAPIAPYPYPVPFSQMPPEEEANVIRNQIEMMEEDIKAAQERLGELETKQD